MPEKYIYGNYFEKVLGKPIAAVDENEKKQKQSKKERKKTKRKQAKRKMRGKRRPCRKLDKQKEIKIK